jgi:aryl-alcohol dehydrogenase-like predicted oxidoreductase
LALAESRFRIGLVQLPLNALDRRPLTSGLLERLKSYGTEIHARSVFLQGLLLMPPSDLPEFFQPVRPELTRLRKAWARQGLSPVAACLAFVLRRTEVDAAIVGVNRLTEFAEIEAAALAAGDIDPELGAALEVAPIYLDPSRWPALH